MGNPGGMTQPDELPDALPDELPDAPPDDAAVPLEADEFDWQEQRTVVEDPEEDFR